MTKEYLILSGNVINIDINMDGLPLFKSGTQKAGKGLWPIVGRLAPSFGSVFVIGDFCGFGEPDDLCFFLEDFLEEVSELKNWYQFTEQKHFCCDQYFYSRCHGT